MCIPIALMLVLVFVLLAGCQREGDTNATTQVMHTIQAWCYELAGRPIPPMPGADSFYEMVDY